MKKTIIFAALALIAVASCQKSQTTAIVDPDENIPEGTLIPILFGSNLAPVSTTTKSIGGVDTWKTTDSVNVYGITRISPEKDALDFDDIRIDNIAIPAVPEEGTLIEVKDADMNPVYYDLLKCYDFFGYYIDDIEATPTVADGTISLPITIDGSQDVMLAAAVRENHQVESISVGRERLFSAYSARKNIHPLLTFKHQLSRFKFIVSNGTSESSNVVRISDLKVKSPSAGILDVINSELNVVTDSETDMYLREVNPETGSTVELQPVVVTSTPQLLGESLMVMPGLSSYELAFTLTQEGVETPENVKDLSIAIPGGLLAEAGKQYTVHITIYDFESIKIEVGIEPWDVVDDIIEIGKD
ncbi:MAG: fimbrillin family protein [Bacteroidales bacterium]|nr:fimbrillin family protein [Bacteroidales bacterium]